MREPRRWLDDANTPPRLRELLNAQSSLPVIPSAVHKRLGAYAAGLAAQGAAGAAAGSWLATGVASKLAVGTLAKAVLVFGLMGAAGTAGYVAVGHRLEQNQGAKAHLVAQKVPGGSAPALNQPHAAATVNALPSPSLEPTRDAAADHSPSARASAGAVPVTMASGSQAPTIADEARLLETARGNLSKDPARALALVRRHEARYPGGQLGAERELIAVDALLRLGRREEAERRAAPRLEDDPDSLYAKRLRQLLGRE